MSTKKQTRLDVQGMSCDSCVQHVNKALSELEGVSLVDVNLSQGKVLVAHDPERAPLPTLIHALSEAGYESAPSLEA